MCVCVCGCLCVCVLNYSTEKYWIIRKSVPCNFRLCYSYDDLIVQYTVSISIIYCFLSFFRLYVSPAPHTTFIISVWVVFCSHSLCCCCLMMLLILSYGFNSSTFPIKTLTQRTQFQFHQWKWCVPSNKMSENIIIYIHILN